ncbi:MAG: aminotransferase class IV [Proteobacteria bacterium]|nr:aminotransferase class IV [Pseudomonadota bacterium]
MYLSLINGQIKSLDETTIPALDRGFLYGEQVIETMLTCHGQVVRLDQHMERLFHSLAAVSITPSITKQELTQHCLKVSSFYPKGFGMIRVMITGGIGVGLTSKTKKNSQYYIFAWPVERPVSPPFSITLRSSIKHRSNLDHIKTGYYFPAITACHQQEVSKEKGQDVLWVSASEEILETTTANIFFVLHSPNKKLAHQNSPNYELVTPGNHGQIFGGLTRKHLIELSKQHGIIVHEKKIYLSDLSQFSECFITSSVQGLVPVVAINNHVFQNGKIGECFHSLRRYYETTLT